MSDKLPACRGLGMSQSWSRRQAGSLSDIRAARFSLFQGVAPRHDELLSDYVETLILKKLNTAGLKPVGASSTICTQQFPHDKNMGAYSRVHQSIGPHLLSIRKLRSNAGIERLRTPLSVCVRVIVVMRALMCLAGSGEFRAVTIAVGVVAFVMSLL